jgi:ferritin-like metal-binding protein YciE
MARQQILLEAQIESHTTQLVDHENRLEQLEEQLGETGRHITTEQASRISQAVKLIAMELSKRSGRNEYGGVYGELYRKFSITSYKELPADKYDEAAAFLKEWYQSLTDDSPF